MIAHLLGNFLALLVSVAGWFYLFHSHNIEALRPVEGEARNSQRIRLRRIGGLLMLMCAAFLYGGNSLTKAVYALACWSMVLILLLGIIVLALMDLRLTMKLRKRN